MEEGENMLKSGFIEIKCTVEGQEFTLNKNQTKVKLIVNLKIIKIWQFSSIYANAAGRSPKINVSSMNKVLESG